MKLNEAIGLWLSPILVDVGHLVDSTLQVWWWNVGFERRGHLDQLAGWIELWILKRLES